MSINIGQIGLPSRNGGGEALESLDQQRALLDQLLDSPLDKDNSRGFRLLRETLLVQQQENSGSDELMEQVYEASVDHSTRHLLQLENNSWCGAFTDHQYSPDRHQHLSELIKALSTLVLSIYPSTNHVNALLGMRSQLKICPTHASKEIFFK